MSLLGRVGLAIGFILLQTKQTNSELGHQDPMLKDLISITWFTQTYPNMMLAKSIYEIFVKFRCMLQFSILARSSASLEDISITLIILKYNAVASSLYWQNICSIITFI